MKNYQDILEVVAQVKCTNPDGTQTEFTTTEAIGGVLIGIKGMNKEWYLSLHSTTTEIVRTMHKMCEFNVIESVKVWFNSFVLPTPQPEWTKTDINIIEMFCQQFNYKNWKIVLDDRETHWLWQIVFDAPDNTTGEIETQHCRKFPIKKISPGLLNKIVGGNTFFEDLKYAVVQAELHEMNEQFKYKNHDIYNPHLDVEVMYQIFKDNEEDRAMLFDARN